MIPNENIKMNSDEIKNLIINNIVGKKVLVDFNTPKIFDFIDIPLEYEDIYYSYINDFVHILEDIQYNKKENFIINEEMFSHI